MDIFLAVLGTICIVVGLLGSLLPVLPGPPISYAGILLLHFSKYAQYGSRFLILFGALTAIVAVLDYVVPVWGTKKFGGSKYGTWGATIGVLIGLFLRSFWHHHRPFSGCRGGRDHFMARNQTRHSVPVLDHSSDLSPAH